MAKIFDGYSFNSYSFCNDIIASGKSCDYDSLPNALFVKTKEMSVKKFMFLLRAIFAISSRNHIAAFKNRSRRALVDQNAINFFFCMKYWLLGVTISLNGL